MLSWMACAVVLSGCNGAGPKGMRTALPYTIEKIAEYDKQTGAITSVGSPVPVPSNDVKIVTVPTLYKLSYAGGDENVIVDPDASAEARISFTQDNVARLDHGLGYTVGPWVFVGGFRTAARTQSNIQVVGSESRLKPVPAGSIRAAHPGFAVEHLKDYAHCVRVYFLPATHPITIVATLRDLQLPLTSDVATWVDVCESADGRRLEVINKPFGHPPCTLMTILDRVSQY